MEYIWPFALFLFCLSAAVFNWDWFFENYKARPVVKLLGRNGARVFYALLGFIIAIVSYLAILYG